METAILLQNPHWNDQTYDHLLTRGLLEKLIKNRL
jgi:hypothetical protein